MNSSNQRFERAESQSLTSEDLPRLSVAEVEAQPSPLAKMNSIWNALSKPLARLSPISPELLVADPMPHQDWNWPYDGLVMVSRVSGESFKYVGGFITRWLEIKDDCSRLQYRRMAEHRIDPDELTILPALTIREQTYCYSVETAEPLMIATVGSLYTSSGDREGVNYFGQNIEACWFEQPLQLTVFDSYTQDRNFLLQHASQRLMVRCLDKGLRHQIDYYERGLGQSDTLEIDCLSGSFTQDSKIISAALMNNTVEAGSILERSGNDYDSRHELKGVAIEYDYLSRPKQVNQATLLDKFAWL